MAEKLNKVSSRKQMIAEKKITDVLYDLEMLGDDDGDGARVSHFQHHIRNSAFSTSSRDSTCNRRGFHMNLLNDYYLD